MKLSARVSRRTILKATPLLAAPWLPSCSKSAAVADGDLLELGARDVVDHIRKKELTAERYVARLLAQYSAHKDLNAVVFIDEGKVMEAARAVDKAVARGDKLGPAAGLPFGVKDQIAAAGYPATGGSGALKGYIPKDNAPVVEAVLKAGGIVFAKTNLPDMVGGYPLAVGAASQNPTFGTPRNPYDPTRMCGGSSGGNGAALAARMIPLAIGEDTSGSVRFPAAMCGLAGLRPSTYSLENALNGAHRKRWPDGGMVVPPAGPRDTFGPMARTVADAAFLDFLVTSETAPTVRLSEIRIAVPRADYWEQDFIEPGVAQVIREAVAKLKSAGANLVEIDFDGMVRALADDKVARAQQGGDGKDLAAWLAENLPGVTVDDVFAGKQIPARRTAQPMDPDERKDILTTAQAKYAAVFKENGIAAVLSPTIPITAPVLHPDGEVQGQTISIKGKDLDESVVLTRNISWGPRMGVPGLNVPAGLADGLPVGIELAGLPGEDSKILGIGMAVEAVLGRLPPPSMLSATT